MLFNYVPEISRDLKRHHSSRTFWDEPRYRLTTRLRSQNFA